MAGAIFIPVFYFHFVVSFLNLIGKYKRVIYGGYGLALGFLLLDFTPYFVRSVEPELFFPFWPKPGVFYHPFLFMFFSFVVYGWYLLLKTLAKEKEKIRKQQIKYFLLGTGIGFICGSTNYFLWYGIPIPPYLNALVSIYVVLTGFAIIKYHLFEIRVILTEILVGVMGILLLIFSFLLPGGYRIFAMGVFLVFFVFAYYLVKATHEESKRREEAERLAREAERLAQVKDQFLLSIQHHLRTPLTPIRGYSSMILEGSYNQEQIKEKILAIKKSADTLHNLMESLLDIQALRVGKSVLNLKECQLADLVKEVIEEQKPQAEQKGLILEFEKEELPEIQLDRKRIKEVIWNLIDNAIKYTNKPKSTIKVKLKKVQREEKEFALLSVTDQGLGMNKEEIEDFLKGKLFERGEEAKKLYGPGRGIGLAIALEFVKAHGGNIWVTSEPGRGARFEFTLPIAS